jgi:hypothetical protein
MHAQLTSTIIPLCTTLMFFLFPFCPCVIDTDTRPIHLAYQPPASITFLSEQTNHQQPANSTFLSEQISTSHQPPAK